MVPRLLLLTSLSACNLVFPLRDTQPSDDGSMPGDDGSIPGDGGLLNPPPGAANCTPPPAFDNFNYDKVQPPFDVGGPITEFSFFRDADTVRGIVVSGDSIYEVPSGGASTTPILTAPPNTSFHSPRTSYDAGVVWFRQIGLSAGVFFAARATGWTKAVADLPFVDVESVEPGAVAFHAGTVRMVVSVRDLAGETALHELSSPNGTDWTELDTVKFAPSGLGDRNAALSPDGCYLLFIGSNGTNELLLSVREPDGTFGSLIELSVPSTAPSSPVLTPDATNLWFTSNVGGDLEFYRGQ